MEILNAITLGLGSALAGHNLIYCLLGVLLGTVVGVLPGLGSTTGVALLMPFAFTLSPSQGLILLAGIYYGCQYGASVTSILIATPGDSANVVTIFDGYPLARQGRAGPTLAISALSHFTAGILSFFLLVALAPAFASVAVAFGPPELVGLILLGFTSIIGFSERSPLKGIAMAALGVAIATIGIDPTSGVARFTFNNIQLYGGIGFIEICIGLFAIGEVMVQLGGTVGDPIKARFRDLLPTIDDLRRSIKSIFRGSILGFLIGVLPGAGATIASFVSYDVERRVSRNKDQFGHGAIEGVAAPEAATSAAVNGAFVPTLTLGIPGSGTTAILLGAFIVFGIEPGPLLFVEHADLAWTLIGSFAIGSVALLFLNLPLVPLFSSVLRVPHVYLYPFIFLLSYIGAYALEFRLWSMFLVLIFGVMGHVMKRHNYPMAPLVLGVVLGNLLEVNMMRSLAMSGGSFNILITRPVAGTLILISLLMLAGPKFLNLFKKLLR